MLESMPSDDIYRLGFQPIEPEEFDESDEPEKPPRLFDPDECDEAAYRMLRDTDAGKKSLDEARGGLGKRARDPEDFADRATCRLADDIRRAIVARRFSAKGKSRILENVRPIHIQLAELLKSREQPSIPLFQVTPQEVAAVMSCVRRLMRLEFNLKRAKKGRMPI